MVCLQKGMFLIKRKMCLSEAGQELLNKTPVSGFRDKGLVILLFDPKERF
jgi:hypothetical protein